jgi:hypothetical protein
MAQTKLCDNTGSLPDSGWQRGGDSLTLGWHKLGAKNRGEVKTGHQVVSGFNATTRMEFGYSNGISAKNREGAFALCLFSA